jgi:hypothetical protein
MLAHHSKRRYPISNDVLFLEKDVYEYKLDYELTIIGYYENPDLHNLKDISMKVLACPIVKSNISKTILSNYKFYADNLSKYKQLMENSLIRTIEHIGNSLKNEDGFVKSTPSMCLFKDNIIINTRYVDYIIDDSGNYITRDKIRSKNVISIIDKRDYKILSEFVLGYDKSLDNLYGGLEDVKLFVSDDGRLLYNANRGIGDSTIRIEHGEIDLEANSTKNSLLLKKNEMDNIEKNWVLFNGSEGLKSVYKWFPILIGDIQNNEFKQTHEENILPDLFRYIRGSTNGVIIEDEIWFICHAVSYEPPSRRYYYHIVVVLDKDSYKLKKYTPFFSFEKESVEYTCGFIEIDTNLFIGYSVLDKTSEYMMVSKDWIKNQFIHVKSE